LEIFNAASIQSGLKERRGGTFGGEGEKVTDRGRLGFLAGGVPRLADGRAATRGALAHQRRLGFADGAGRQGRGWSRSPRSRNKRDDGGPRLVDARGRFAVHGSLAPRGS